jgi:hypothetical protein
MSVDIIRTADSIIDLHRILGYFLDKNEPGVAMRFLDAYEKTLTFIGNFPRAGKSLGRKRIATEGHAIQINRGLQ